MNYVLLLTIISFVPAINGFYSPIPVGSIIISTTRTISVMQPKEYGGTDNVTVIFKAAKNMTIVNTVFDSTSRELYILYANSTDNIIYICFLKSVKKLDTISYKLPISFNVSHINKLTSFSSDVKNNRAFLTNESGIVTMFSLSGSMESVISPPVPIDSTIRSVGYNQALNRLFIITDSTVYSCTGLDQNQLECCHTVQKLNQLRSITFDPSSSTSYAYVIDEQNGIYQVVLDNSCPTTLRLIDSVSNYYGIQLVVDKDLYFCSGSGDTSYHNSILIIGNGIQAVRTIPFETPIVALHVSYWNAKSTVKTQETCFHGITYYDYRVAVVLAAIFGTVMGIFMCFNALFCIDFFMTKRIIEDLKKQIPHNLLEDRWNKLVQEKYAKLALEIHRKKDDPPPKRKSSAGVRKASTDDNAQLTNQSESRPISNPIPKISAYIRRKSESYLSHRKSDEYRNQQHSNAARSSPKPDRTTTTTTNVPQAHIQGIKEEEIDLKKLRENVNSQNSMKNEGELL